MTLPPIPKGLVGEKISEVWFERRWIVFVISSVFSTVENLSKERKTFERIFFFVRREEVEVSCWRATANEEKRGEVDDNDVQDKASFVAENVRDEKSVLKGGGGETLGSSSSSLSSKISLMVLGVVATSSLGPAFTRCFLVGVDLIGEFFPLFFFFLGLTWRAGLAASHSSQLFTSLLLQNVHAGQFQPIRFG